MIRIQKCLAFLLLSAVLAPFGAWATAPVSEENHQQFEKKFAEMCIEKEKKDMQGSGVLLSEVVSLCECIAREESKRITSAEVKEFVFDNQYPASLMMKSNAATYTCVEAQKKGSGATP